MSTTSRNNRSVALLGRWDGSEFITPILFGCAGCYNIRICDHHRSVGYVPCHAQPGTLWWYVLANHDEPSVPYSDSLCPVWIADILIAMHDREPKEVVAFVKAVYEESRNQEKTAL